VTPTERFEAAGRWLVSVGGQASPGEIGAVLGLNHARQADVVRALRRAELVAGSQAQVRLTSAGWARFGGVYGESAGTVLDRVLDGWPAQHRAFLVLLVSATIARHHLGLAQPSGHLGFMAIGETGTGKSSMGELMCHLFGWAPEVHSVHVPGETRGSLLGRREETTEGWRWEPAPMTRLPFVLLDEFDKADRPVQIQASNYLTGKTRQQFEGRVHELLPTPLLTANPPVSGGRYRDLRPEYRRRSVVLDTAAMAGRGRELERLLTRFYAETSPADRLSLDRLVPPARLDDSARAPLELVDIALTPAGREEFPGVRSLELAALGRCALLGPDAAQDLAAYATALDYLQVTESVPGQVDEHWAYDFSLSVRANLGADAEELVAALERGRAQQQQAAQAARTGRQSKVRVELEVLEGGAALAERCRQLRLALDGRKVPGERRPDAAALRRVLGIVGNRAALVSTAVSLREVQEQAADPLARAARLVDEVASARVQQVQDVRQESRNLRQDRAAVKIEQARARSAAKARRDELRAWLDGVTGQAKPLEVLYKRTTTRAGENPLAGLVALRVEGRHLLTFSETPREERGRGLGGMLLGLAQARTTGTWQVRDSRAAFPGTRTACPALASWGPATRAVLTPMLAGLYVIEDQIRAELGISARQRPQLPAGAIPARVLTSRVPVPDLTAVPGLATFGARYGLVR
jgi:hypothetical protein